MIEPPTPSIGTIHLGSEDECSEEGCETTPAGHVEAEMEHPQGFTVNVRAHLCDEHLAAAFADMFDEDEPGDDAA